ncbi:hypothetical protein EJ04DRAFT_487632 [Polyplosphaeria fusca]|uniref:WD repeat protein n=1 Tax=Polyplosphaeria fusca TaxID=682080 RepID=A0A9P4R6J3_9PLEO|nr:hypothetical protein EJ04DRAFT_487632 [Polyplosphaeria fusca]
MADFVGRRVSAAAAPPPQAPGGQIPIPPPLPPPTKSYFSRFVTQPLTSAYASGSRPPSAQTNRGLSGGRPNPLVPRAAGVRSGSSQDASHKTGLDISALDINRARTHAILAGKEILKTVRVEDAKVVEETNLRAAVIQYAQHNAATPSHARQRDGLGIHDVKWSHGHFSTHIATAAANGKVILYDLNRAGVELARLHEHTRQVHRLGFNPHQGHLLLSASHDATVRLWDLRELKKEVMTCPSRDVYAGQSTGIRDVQWSPTDAVEFAFGTDNGVIQRWDFRQNKGPKQKITAHDQRTCTSIDWHPDGRHLLSSGVDKTVKVWDFSVDGRRHKAAFVLTTPYPVHKARWRPPCWSDDSNEKGGYRCTQLATSYDRDHPAIHVWDIRRPFLPFREINRFTSAPSDMLWRSRDTLWTVGREGVFQQNDVRLAPKVIDRRSLQAFAVSPSGDICAFVQRRNKRLRSGLDYSTEDTYPGDLRDKRSSPEKYSLRSSADDSLDDSFLGSSFKRHHGRTASNRSAQSFGSTPPSDSAPKVMFLTDSMVVPPDTFRLEQVAFRGTVPGSSNVQIFAYLAQKYKAIPLPDPPTLQSYLDLRHVFEQNAEYAQRAAFYRLAETWRVLGTSISVATRRRAELHRKRRLQHKQTTTPAPCDVRQEPSFEQNGAHDKLQAQPPNPALRAILGTIDKSHPSDSTASLQSANESSSNLATPLARPLTSSSSAAINAQQLPQLPDPDHDEAIKLPPALAGPSSTGKEVAPSTDTGSKLLAPERPDFNSPQWYQSSDDLDERRALIGSWRAPPRPPLSLEPASTQGLNIQIPPRLGRHDSDESFAMFSASTDSQRGTSMPSSFASGRSLSQSNDKWQRESVSERSQPLRSAEISHASDRRALGTSSLGEGAQISPTTVPIGRNHPRPVPPDRGVQLGSGRETGPSLEVSSREKAVHDIETLRKNNQLLRHDSSESEAYASSRDEVSTTSLNHSIDMEASGTIVPDFHEEMNSPQGQRPPVHLPHATESAPPVLDPASEDPLLLSDFQAMHVDAEGGSPFAVIGLLRNILAYHTTNLSDAQTSSLILLLVMPFLPQTQAQFETLGVDISDVLSNFSEVFTNLGLTLTQAKAILATQLSQILATGINPYQAEAILHTYHTQLHDLGLYNAAASLRRIAYPTWPAVYEQALKDTQLGLLCLSCNSPINNPKDKMRCETCKRAQAPCPICWARYPAFEPVSAKKKAKAKFRSNLNDREHKRKRSSLLPNPQIGVEVVDDGPSPTTPEKHRVASATLWTWCSLCGHGGHTNCLSTWFADPGLSEGTCPTEGCLCDCVPGKRREDVLRDVARKKSEKDAKKLVRKGDDWKVDESKAVSAVRGAIGDPSAVREPNQSAISSAAPTAGARKEDSRRVRVVGPRDAQR